MQCFAQGIRRVGVEENLNPGGYIVRQVDQGPATRYGHEDSVGAFLHCELDYVDRVVDRFDRAAQGNSAGDDQATLQGLAEQGGAKPDEDADAKLLAALRGIEGSKLESKFVLAWIALANKFP